MFLPFYDGKPVQYIRRQWVTLSVIGINILVYFIVNVGASAIGESGFFVLSFGHVPSVSNDLRVLPLANQIIPDSFYFLTTITSAFLHADLWHLFGNMIFIWVFADNVEDAMGHVRFAIFYVLCALAAAWFHSFVFYESDAPLIGASGAAAGMVAAYLMLHPKMKIWVLFMSRIPLRLPALWVLGAWVAFQVFMFITDSDGKVSWAAHIGGILAGLLLVGILKRRAVPLFDRELIVPDAVEIAPEAALPEDVKRSPWGR